jgi:hypothetical protein
VHSIPFTQLAMGQLGSIAHDPMPSQSVSQRQESEQSMPPEQVPGPLHETSQRPGPQVIGPLQAPVSSHRMSHPSAALQSTPAAQLV